MRILRAAKMTEAWLVTLWREAEFLEGLLCDEPVISGELEPRRLL